MKTEFKVLLGILAAFLGLYYLPVESLRFQGAVLEALILAKWYAREHVILCLVPAFFIAGAIGVFVSQNAVMKYFGPKASKWLSYSVASVSGTILAVCSCTVLPLFGGIYFRGAGLGPAVAFLYSGPAINVLAIVLTARVLGLQLGIARAVGAIVFSVVIGLLMHLIFLKEEREKAANPQEVFLGDEDKPARPLWQVALYFFSMVGILVFANWARPEETSGVWFAIFKAKWILTAAFSILLGFSLWRFFKVKMGYILLAAVPAIVLGILLPQYPVAAFAAGAAGLAALTFFGGAELKDWRDQSWGFAKQILPLLFMGVLAAGFFLGSPDSADAGIIPNRWIQALVGDSPQRPAGHPRPPRRRRPRLAGLPLAAVDQFLRLRHRCPHVLRHADRSPHPARAPRQRHGPGPRPRPPPRRPRPLAAQHARHQFHPRPEKNPHLRRPGRRHGHDLGHAVWMPGELKLET
jgi:uncharacterized protein